MKTTLSFKYSLAILVLLLSNFAAAMTRIHVIPMAFNPSLDLPAETTMNQRWSALLSHIPGTNAWTSFHADTNIPFNSPDQDIGRKAIRILAKQTANRYLLNVDSYFQQEPQVQIHRAAPNIYLFMPVNFIRGNTLYQTARNQYRDNFGWFTIQEILDLPANALIGRVEQFPIDPALHNVMRGQLPGLYQYSPGFYRRVWAGY